jgi:DNA-binding IclR family transcriptional regulator
LLEIDRVTDVLRNGEWHKLSKIVEECKLPKVKVEVILKFLAEYGFIETNNGDRKVKISPSLQSFLKEIRS